MDRKTKQSNETKRKKEEITRIRNLVGELLKHGAFCSDKGLINPFSSPCGTQLTLPTHLIIGTFRFLGRERVLTVRF